MKRVLVSWSTGKDSAWTLYTLQRYAEIEVVGLLTTVNQAFARVAMHGVRRELVEAQARATGLPLWEVPLPWPCSNAEYEDAMRAACARARAEGVEVVAFGDLFLEDVRRYREERLQGTGLEPLFPLWGRPTDQLARTMISAGLRARIVCLDPKALSLKFAGREYDGAFLGDLPPSVDPCGERGEFHSFVYAGPMFRQALEVICGATVTRDGYMFTDLRPSTES